ncbi:MAG: hypothetical protein RML99_08230 [Anaerolineae bacterium]|nr:hypothetical protein [Anaerolineae bacterium]
MLAGDPGAVREIERIALLSNLEELIAESRQLAELREHRFASAIPLLGPMIAALRSAVHTLTARWPLRAALEQQTRFNRAASHALAELLVLNCRLLERIERLEEQMAELERAQGR